ncbi:MAG: BON domain-containing protein [Planctomycetes bacterium]|nr:BON domain-containing protein [Planctomycetota bacterium]
MSFGSHCLEKSHAVVQEVRDRLEKRLHTPVLSESCDYRGGVLFLRGQSSSFYEKQVVQEAARGVSGVARIVNDIDVVARPV